MKVKLDKNPGKLLNDTLNQSEDQENLKAWIEESERRYEAVKKGELGVIDYSDIKKQLAGNQLTYSSLSC